MTLWLVCGPVAVLAAAGCAVVAATTFLPDPLVVPRWVGIAFVLPAFPIMVISVATGVRMRRKRRSILSTIESVSPNAWPLAGLLFVAFFVIAFTGYGGPPGEPEIRDGHYFLDYRGVRTEISREQYEQYEPLERRTEAGIGGGLCTPGIALGMYMRERHRRSKLAPPAGSRRH